MTTIPAAFDSALASARIDKDSIRWETKTTLLVTIDGIAGRRTMRARPASFTVDGLHNALTIALRDYCAIAAAEMVAA